MRTAACTLLALLVLGVSGCTTFQQLAELRRVDFALGAVQELRLAGVDLMQVRGVEDLTAIQLGRIALAISGDELPLELTLGVLAENPADNPATARLTRMDWTLLIEDTETVSGVIDEEVVLEPGVPRTIPIRARVDLLDFSRRSARDLAELALSLAGAGGAPKNVAIRARPVISTPIGSIRYPEPITIVDRELGGQR